MAVELVKSKFARPSFRRPLRVSQLSLNSLAYFYTTVDLICCCHCYQPECQGPWVLFEDHHREHLETVWLKKNLDCSRSRILKIISPYPHMVSCYRNLIVFNIFKSENYFKTMLQVSLIKI